MQELAFRLAEALRRQAPKPEPVKWHSKRTYNTGGLK